MKNTRCTFCKNNNLILIGKFKEVHVFTLYRCAGCGAHFQVPIPSKKLLKTFYENLYKGAMHIESTEKAFLEKDALQEKKRLQAIERYKKGGKILDIGASSGFFLSEVKKNKSWKIFGIEYAKSGVKKALNEFGIVLEHGEIYNSSFPDNYFDVITMHSVLEHVPDQHEYLDWIYRKLKKGGLFVFNVPNIKSFEYMLYALLGKKFPGYIFEHLYYYNPAVVRKMLKSHGFKTQKVTSRHYAHISIPPARPLIGLLTFPMKLFLEYTDLGGKLLKGNILYVYAKK